MNDAEVMRKQRGFLPHVYTCLRRSFANIACNQQLDLPRLLLIQILFQRERTSTLPKDFADVRKQHTSSAWTRCSGQAFLGSAGPLRDSNAWRTSSVSTARPSRLYWTFLRDFNNELSRCPRLSNVLFCIIHALLG